MNPVLLARHKIAAIDKAIADLAAERSDWKALLEAAERLGPRLVVDDIDTALAKAPRLSTLRTPYVESGQRDAAAKTTKKGQVLAIAASALDGNRHMQAKELADVVIAQGIDLGMDPVQYVSVLLSRDGRFKSERAKGGWTMKTGPSNEEAPQDVDASAGPDLLDLQPASVTAGTGPTPD